MGIWMTLWNGQRIWSIHMHSCAFSPTEQAGRQGNTFWGCQVCLLFSATPVLYPSASLSSVHGSNQAGYVGIGSPRPIWLPTLLSTQPSKSRSQQWALIDELAIWWGWIYTGSLSSWRGQRSVFTGINTNTFCIWICLLQVPHIQTTPCFPS